MDRRDGNKTRLLVLFHTIGGPVITIFLRLVDTGFIIVRRTSRK
jgi:hypothetical protein